MYHIPSLKLNKKDLKQTHVFFGGEDMQFPFLGFGPIFSAGKRTRWHSFPSTHQGDDLFQIYVPSGVRPQRVRWSDPVDGNQKSHGKPTTCLGSFWNPEQIMGISVYPFNWLYHRLSVPSTVVRLFCFLQNSSWNIVEDVWSKMNAHSLDGSITRLISNLTRRWWLNLALYRFFNGQWNTFFWGGSLVIHWWFHFTDMGYIAEMMLQACPWQMIWERQKIRFVLEHSSRQFIATSADVTLKMAWSFWVSAGRTDLF